MKYGRKSANSKELRQFLKYIEDAGGRVRPTKNGHFKVYGPRGMATISKPVRDPRSHKNAVTQCRQYAGLDVKSIYGG